MRYCLLLLSCLFLVSCGPKAGKEDQSGPVLTLWHIMNYSGPREILQEAVERFKAENPGCQVKVQTFENDAYKVKLSVEMASGNPPDILFTWGGGHLAEMAKAGKVLDITADCDQRFLPAALDLCTCDGKVYGAPLDLSVVLFWCNRQLFQKHKLDYPASFGAFMDCCRAFRAAGIEPCALGNKNQWPGAFYYSYLANRLGGTELFLKAAQEPALFQDPSFVKAGQMVREMVDAKAFPTGFNGVDDGPARARFLSGKAAMLLMGSWVVARVKAEKPEFLETMDPMPFPQVEGGKGDPSTVLGGVNCAFAISSSCNRPDLARRLLKHLTSEAVVSGWCDIGRIPALKTTAEQEASLPAATRKALESLRNAKSLQPYYDQYLSPRLAVAHKNNTQALFAGTATPEEAARLER